MNEETIPVVPASGQVEQVAKDLIRLADHPHDVVYRSRENDFMVPESVAIRYAEEQAGQLAAAAEAQAGDKAATKAPGRASRRRASSAAAAPGEPQEPAAPRARRRAKGGEQPSQPKRSRKKKGEEVNPDA